MNKIIIDYNGQSRIEFNCPYKILKAVETMLNASDYPRTAVHGNIVDKSNDKMIDSLIAEFRKEK